MRTGIAKLDNKNDMSLAEACTKGRNYVADALTYLTSSKVQNFYARIIGLMDRVEVPGLGTMAVSAHEGRYLFMYDPLFAYSRSYEEVCATCEHEVMHLILEHIPRMQTLLRVYVDDEDRHLIKLTSNMAVDLAVNEFLARSWPKVKHPDQPLGFWVIPEGFQPPLPRDMAYEDYQELLIALLLKRLNTSPEQLYKLASKILEKQNKAIQDALKQQSQNGNNDSEGEDKDKNADPQEGQGGGSEQPQEGENSSGGTSPQDLEDEIKNLDAMDQKILQMVVESMRSHLAWSQSTGSDSEGDTHKLIENGKELIKSAISSENKSRGTIPGHVMELIRKMLAPPTVSWIQLLREMVQRTQQTKKERGMSRASKKLAALKVFARLKENDARFARFAHSRRMTVFPGIKHSNKFTIYYVVDTSGSMSIKELSLGLSELQHIQKADSDISICVIYADTQVCKEYWIDASGEIDTELTGRGGTDFELVFQHIDSMCGHTDKAPDIVIYCTDGYAPAPTTRVRVPVVWLLTPTGQPVMRDSGHVTIQMRDYQLEDSSV